MLRLPSETSLSNNPRPTRFDPRVIEGGFGAGRKGPDKTDDDGDETAIQVPLLGRIAAGTPIEALRDHSGACRHSRRNARWRGEYYCLEVEGDSMIDAGILEGDTVIIERCDSADNGAIVVALVEGHEVTLKRLRRRNNSVALEPAQPPL